MCVDATQPCLTAAGGATPTRHGVSLTLFLRLHPPALCLAPMASCFAIDASDGGARAGTLATRTRAITTPMAFVATQRGGAPNLLPDQLEELLPEAQAVQLNVLSL